MGDHAEVSFFGTLLRVILGALGPLLDWMIAHQSVVTIAFAVLLGVYALGRYQLGIIARNTEELVIRRFEEFVREESDISPEALYRRIYPEWAESVKKWAWFVPHRFDLWPVPANERTVKGKIGFSPEWISDVLSRHGSNVVPEAGVSEREDERQ